MLIMITQTDTASLKKMNASDFEDGDILFTDKYMIYIVYGKYNAPLESYVEDRKTHKILGCTPGTPGGWPYYIADFLNR